MHFLMTLLTGSLLPGKCCARKRVARVALTGSIPAWLLLLLLLRLLRLLLLLRLLRSHRQSAASSRCQLCCKLSEGFTE